MARWQSHRGFAPIVLVAVVIASMVALLGTGMSRVMAQGEAASHPAHIHDGTCAELGDVVYPLTNVSATGMMEGMMGGTPAADAPPMEMSEPMGAEAAIGVATSFSLVDASLEDILAAPHAINVHESEANIGNYIACGDVGGAIETGPGMEEGGTLVLGLGELNDSGYSGIAVLEGRGDQTEVIIYLAEGLAGDAAGAADDAEATPDAAAGADASADEVMVDIADFAFDPETVEVAVGGTITWTNQDSAQHTATGRDRDLLQSGTLQQGDSYSETFDTAGTYEYFCEFHATMNGTIVVE